MFEKLASVEARYDQLMAEMADPAVQATRRSSARTRKRWRRCSRWWSSSASTRTVVAQIIATEELMQDPDMRELAQEELKALEHARDALLADIKVLLVPKDPNDEKNVILEIRGGTGGDEAALFASDLFRMYSRYAERKGWKVEVLNLSESGVGGIKEVIAIDRRARRLQPPEVRQRRPPRPARAGDRGERPHPHVDRHRRRAAGSRRSRHPDRREGPPRSTRSARAGRAARASTRPTPRSASPTSRPAWSSRSRTRNRRSRTARRR